MTNSTNCFKSVDKLDKAFSAEDCVRKISKSQTPKNWWQQIRLHTGTQRRLVRFEEYDEPLIDMLNQYNYRAYSISLIQYQSEHLGNTCFRESQNCIETIVSKYEVHNDITLLKLNKAYACKELPVWISKEFYTELAEIISFYIQKCFTGSLIRAHLKSVDHIRFQNVFVNPDLSPSEREAHKVIRDQLREKRLANPTIHYVIRKSRVIRKFDSTDLSLLNTQPRNSDLSLLDVATSQDNQEISTPPSI
ncbi:hypothetical protein GJ496_000803 [Pomphorhynchus laevis]|nr:hypothetical protein GJ496_000803 [Pomphorhynchus laevis]